MKARQQLRPIYDAAWELCRIGVLRPGRGVQRSCSSRHRGPPGDVAAWPAALGHGRRHRSGSPPNGRSGRCRRSCLPHLREPFRHEAREHAFPVGAVGLGRALASSRQLSASKNKSTAGGRMRAAWVKSHATTLTGQCGTAPCACIKKTAHRCRWAASCSFGGSAITAAGLAPERKELSACSPEE